ncbi:hypothetical protein V8E52_009407 [Russula decolorans]
MHPRTPPPPINQSNQNPLGPESPTTVKEVQSLPPHQTGNLEDARQAVLRDMGSFVPMVSFQTFLDKLAPLPPDSINLNATMQSLRLGLEPALTPSNKWSKFAKAPKDSQDSEDTTFSPMPEIFTKVVAAIVANSDGKLKEADRTVDFLQHPNHAPISAEGNNESRPDGYLVLRNRNKQSSKDGKREEIHWVHIVLSCEYKKKDKAADLNDDVRKCLWNLQQVMRDDPRRRFSFGITIQNSTTRVWFCCRSFVVVSKEFDFIKEPIMLVKLFAAFAFADQTSLGFDPTIQPVTGGKGQFDITVHPHDDKQNPRKFRTMQSISLSGAEPLRGRGTRVFEAVEIDGNGNSTGSPVVIKDVWIDDDRNREGKIRALLDEDANDEDKQSAEEHFLTPICHGDVWVKINTPDDTTDALMRGLDVTRDPVLDRDWLFTLQQTPLSRTSTQASRSTSLQAGSLPQDPQERTYAHKTHYRIVFKEKGIPIDRLRSLHDVMTALIGAVNALRHLRKVGWVHRDVSAGNILFCDGHGKLADLEYAKKMGESKSHGMRTGTKNFMSIEIAAEDFLFFPSESGPSSAELDETMIQDEGKAESEASFYHNHLHDLESLWWVAVWVVFYNNFLEETPSQRPSTLKDAQDQLKLAGTFFPRTLDSAIRRDGLRTRKFLKKCDDLPRNKKLIYDRLNLLRRLLISHYTVIEANYPKSVDPSSSKDDIYDEFIRLFSKTRTDYPNSVLDSIPDRCEKMSKEEKNSKRNRSESSTTVGPNPKR